MQPGTMLREQARLLRDLAAKSTADPETYVRLLALAQQCDELATAFGETPSRPPSQPTRLRRKPH